MLRVLVHSVGSKGHVTATIPLEVAVCSTASTDVEDQKGTRHDLEAGVFLRNLLICTVHPYPNPKSTDESGCCGLKSGMYLEESALSDRPATCRWCRTLTCSTLFSLLSHEQPGPLCGRVTDLQSH